MADVKNFGISGVGADVQLGKAGAHIKSADGHIEIRNPDNSALTTARGANAVVASEFVTLAQLQAVQAEAGDAVGAVDGFSVKLGDIATKGDGDWTPGAVALDDDTPVSEAVDRLNEVLSKLIPAQPPQFPNGALSVTNTSGNTPFLASGAVPDNTSGGSLPNAGTAVTRITATGVNSNTFTGVGPGETGTVQLLVNNAIAASKVLTGSGDNGSAGGLTIAGQADYPVSTPGFWKSINVAVSGAAVAAGLNRFKLNHTAAGTTNEVTFVRDTMTSAAALSAGSVAQNVAGTVGYSSGVPHYATGGSLTVGFTLANLSGETYYGGNDPVVLSGTNGVIANQIVGYAGLGLTTPLARNLAATASTPITLLVNGTNVFAVGTVQAVVKNVNATNAAVNVASTNILAMIGTQSGKVYEMNFPVSGLGSIPNNNNGVRVNLPAGDNPAGATSAFNSADALAAHEAAVVAGVLKHDKTNYSTGYLPAGPDYSVGRDGAQYLTVSFNRAAVSKFTINVTGSYSGAWVKIPGVSDNASISANGATVNGWWDMFKPYDGAGVPGETGDALNGAAVGNVMTGASGPFVATFGTQTSTNATGNQILVRFKLNPGQSITALSFSA